MLLWKGMEAWLDNLSSWVALNSFALYAVTQKTT